jgi:CheY-like chemotaxis protein
MNHLRILIVEDDPDSADMVHMLLSSAGIETHVVGSAEAALTELKTASGIFNALIIDLALPEMDGMELMQILRQKSELSHMPLIAVTAYHTPELKARVLDAGFDAYFAKPLDTMLFVRALERLLSSVG